MKPVHIFPLIVLFLFLNINKAQAQTEKISQPVLIPNTEMRSFYSEILGQDMILFIKLPSGYNNNSQRLYPSWYFTDGNRSFPLIANIASIFEIPVPSEPELIIISIAYKIKDMADWGAWRTRDLTPTNVPSLDSSWAKTLTGITGRQFEVKSGGAKKFLECLEKEVIPLVESSYRVLLTDRGLGGYSYGGLFSLYVLFSQPELFSIYYAGSPSISYDNGVLFNLEKDFSISHKNLKAKLFMSTGEAEDSTMIYNMKKMASLLESRKYPGLSITTCVFQNETHQSCIPASIMRAFRILYNQP
jgi:predicted alpha/beta superfamily hydrolase